MTTAETVTGRDWVRATGPEPEHDVRFRGAVYPRGSVIAYCVPCNWGTTLAGSHTAADLARLEAQHAGTEDP